MPKNRRYNDSFIFNLNFYDGEVKQILNCIACTIEMMYFGEYNTSYYLKSNFYNDVADLKLLRDSILSSCNDKRYNNGNSIIYKDWLYELNPKYFWLNKKIKNDTKIKKFIYFLIFFNKSIDKQKFK